MLHFFISLLSIPFYLRIVIKVSFSHLNRAAIKKSMEELLLLGALTDEFKLSDPVGRQMARLPLDPVYSKALILASQFKCLDEMLIAVAMLSVESIFYEPRDKLDEVCYKLLLLSCMWTWMYCFSFSD